MSARGKAIRFAGVSRSFGEVCALLKTELEIDAGEFLTLFSSEPHLRHPIGLLSTLIISISLDLERNPIGRNRI